jgi:hypothetical protein
LLESGLILAARSVPLFAAGRAKRDSA